MHEPQCETGPCICARVDTDEELAPSYHKRLRMNLLKYKLRSRQLEDENIALRAKLARADGMAEAIEMDGHAFARNYYQRIDAALAAYRADGVQP